MEDTTKREVYWDGGPRKIQAFLKQHVESGMCSKNYICSGLNLTTLDVEDVSSPTRGPLRHGKC